MNLWDEVQIALDLTLRGTITVVGSFEVGGTLSVNTNNLSGSGELSYVWQRRNASSDANPAFILVDSRYTLQPADAGKYISVIVSRTGYAGHITSPLYGPIRVSSSLNITVGINGTEVVGETLTAVISAPDSSLEGFTYQWRRDGVVISNATGRTYTLVVADYGKLITVTVTRTGYAGEAAAQIGPVMSQ